MTWISIKLGLEAGVVDGVRRRFRKRRQGRDRGENGLKVVLKEVIVRTGIDILLFCLVWSLA